MSPLIMLFISQVRMFVLLPVFALLIKIVFPRRLYFDHIIFSAHLHSAAYVLLAYFLGYFAISVRIVYNASWLIASAKSLAVLFGYMVLVSGVIEATSNFQILAD